MKLRTFSPADESFAAMAVGNRKADLAYDAAVAHALLIAMGEADPDSDYRLGTELQRIRTRADEILAEWGCGDGCG